MRKTTIALTMAAFITLSGCTTYKTDSTSQRRPVDLYSAAAPQTSADRSTIITSDDERFSQIPIEINIDAFVLGMDEVQCVNSLSDIPFSVLCRIPDTYPEADRTETATTQYGMQEQIKLIYCTPQKTEKWLQENISPDIKLDRLDDIDSFTADDGLILLNKTEQYHYEMEYCISNIMLIQELEDETKYLFTTRQPNKPGHGQPTGKKLYLMTYDDDISSLKVEDVTDKAYWLKTMRSLKYSILSSPSAPHEESLNNYDPIYVKQDSYYIIDLEGDGKAELIGTSKTPSADGTTIIYDIENKNLSYSDRGERINGMVCYDNLSGAYSYITTNTKYDLQSITKTTSVSDISGNIISEITEYIHNDMYSYTANVPCCNGNTHLYLDGEPATLEQISAQAEYISKRFIPTSSNYDINSFFDMFYDYYGDTWNN